MVDLKRCPICRGSLPVSSFYLVTKHTDGGEYSYRMSYCKPCSNDVRNRQRRERVSVRQILAHIRTSSIYANLSGVTLSSACL